MQIKFIWYRYIIIALTFGWCFGTGLDFLSSHESGLSLTTQALAQDESAEVAEEEAAMEGAPSTFMDYWKQGGTTMWPLLGLAIWATAVLIELLLKLRVKLFCPPGVIQQLGDAITVGDYQKAWKLGMDNPCPLTHVFCPAIEKLPKGRDAVEETAAESTSNVNNIYTIKNSNISLCAAIGPLLGLFGTISGMIGAFNAMAYGGAVGDPTKLAGDIGEALLTTYTGLLIAIPCMVIFYVMGNRLKKMIGLVQVAILDLIDMVNFDSLPPDLIVATREMKAMAASGAVGKTEIKKAAKPASAAAAKPASAAVARPAAAASAKPVAAAAVKPEAPVDQSKVDVVPCPNCNKDIEVGTKACPHCNTEIDWE